MNIFASEMGEFKLNCVLCDFKLVVFVDKNL